MINLTVITEVSVAFKTRDQVIPPEVNQADIKISKTFHPLIFDDVNYISFEGVKMEKIPKGLEKVFKNIESLTIDNANLTSIEKEDLMQFPNLNYLDIRKNPLETLPGDLFEFNKNLREIMLCENKIKYIGAELLDDLPSLRHINFGNNVNIDTSFFSYNDSIERLREIFLKDCNPEYKLQFKVSKFNEDIEKFSKVEEFKDFTIKIDEVEFKVHKFVFMARSATFAEMIKNNPNAEELKLTDISVEVFESILNYVYTDEKPKNVEKAREIFSAAGKLKIEGLKEISAQILINELMDKDLDYLMAILDLGTKFECQKLRLKAFEEIKTHFLDKELKYKLLNQPENLKKIIETKKELNKLLED